MKEAAVTQACRPLLLMQPLAQRRSAFPFKSAQLYNPMKIKDLAQIDFPIYKVYIRILSRC